MESRGEEGKNILYEFGVQISSRKAELAGLMNLCDSLKKRKEQLDEVFSAQRDEEEDIRIPMKRWSAARRIFVRKRRNLRGVQRKPG